MKGWDGGGGGDGAGEGAASAHLATYVGYTPKASHISQLKDFVGEVFNMTGSICCCLCVLFICL